MAHRFPDEPEILIETVAGQQVVVNPEGSTLKLTKATMNARKTQARVVTAGTFASPEPPPPPPPPDTTYTFRDEFDGSGIDPAKWHMPPSPPLGDEGGSNWDNSACTVEGGMLHMRAVRISPNRWKVPCLDTSRGLFKQRYGIFEARIKVPKGNGLWPAWWGISEHGDNGGPWGPSELDFLELLANEVGSNNNGTLSDDVRKAHQVVHWADGSQTHNGHVWPEPLSNAFHVYGCEWRANFVQFYIDDVKTRRHDFSDPNRLAGAMPVTLNLAAGGWPGPTDASTPSPADMIVDWVRVRA